MAESKFKSGFVAIVGRPNVGKSTLMNHLIGQKIAITSRKPQTTRNRIQTVYTDDECQIVFLDTPGIHKAKNRLGEYMDEVALETFAGADLILWLVEPDSFSGEGEKYIASELALAKRPVILVMNKMDTVSEEDLKGFMEHYKALYPFDEIIPVSALRDRNTDLLIKAMKDRLPEGPAFYDEDTVTDQTMRQIAAEIIREKALRCLNEEVPHGIAVEILSMKERKKKRKRKACAEGYGREGAGKEGSGKEGSGNEGSGKEVSGKERSGKERSVKEDPWAAGKKADPYDEYEDPAVIWDIEADIITEKESHKGIIIGKGGAMLKRIGVQSRKGIEDMTQSQVNLKLFVKVRQDWRDNPALMKSLGYEMKKKSGKKR